MGYLDEYGEVLEHCFRVSRLVEGALPYLPWVSTRLGRDLVEAARVHDIGKFYIKRSVLYSSRNLSDVERDIVDLHSYMGYSVLLRLGSREEVCLMVLLHHGVGKWFIPPVADLDPDVVRVSSILTACDIWDALTTDRVYRVAVSPSRALEVLMGNGSLSEDVCRAVYEAGTSEISV